MSKALETGKSFVQQLAERLPEGSRAAFLASFEGQEDALKFAGESALLRPDYSKAMNDLKLIEAKQTAWWEENRALAELGQKAKTAGFDPATNPNPTPTLPGDVPAGITGEELDKRLNEREMGAAAFFAQLNTLSLRHFQQFGEVLDTDALTRQAANDPQKRGLVAVYQATHAEKIAAKAKEVADADFNRRYQERRAEELKLERNRPPDVVSPGQGGSPLDALTPKPGGPGAGVDTAELVDMYNELVAQGQK